MPDVAVEAYENDSSGMVLKIMSLRSYARAKAAWDAASKDQSPKASERRIELQSTPVVGDVVEIEFELAMEARERFKQRQQAEAQ